MDPNEALRLIRAYIKQMRVENPIGSITSGTTAGMFVQHAVDLAEQVEALDEWLSKEGFAPADWESEDTEKTAMAQALRDLVGDHCESHAVLEQSCPTCTALVLLLGWEMTR